MKFSGFVWPPKGEGQDRSGNEPADVREISHIAAPWLRCVFDGGGVSATSK
jgi:hypothetical protein